jgi:hypothetical protein
MPDGFDGGDGRFTPLAGAVEQEARLRPVRISPGWDRGRIGRGCARIRGYRLRGAIVGWMLGFGWRGVSGGGNWSAGSSSVFRIKVGAKDSDELT